jgi:hypothetical protein
MSGAYTSDGRRKSSITHSTRGHECDLCKRVVFGNGGKVSHGRWHVRRGEAVELVKHYGHDQSDMRLFLAPDDPQIQKFLDGGFEKVEWT